MLNNNFILKLPLDILYKNKIYSILLKNVNKFFLFNIHNIKRKDYFTELYTNPNLVYYFNSLTKLKINDKLVKILILVNDKILLKIF